MAPLAIGDPAPDLRLLDVDERSVQLSDLWGRSPTVVVFLRHFG
jgi:peroxiredoxin